MTADLTYRLKPSGWPLYPTLHGIACWYCGDSAHDLPAQGNSCPVRIADRSAS